MNRIFNQYEIENAENLYQEACKGLSFYGSDKNLKTFYTNVLRHAENLIQYKKILKMQEVY